MFVYIVLLILAIVEVYIPKNHGFYQVKELSLTTDSPLGSPISTKISYTSAELKAIGNQMKRKVPNFSTIRTIKRLKINRRRIRLQKFWKRAERKINLQNIVSLQKDIDVPVLNHKFISFGTVNARSIRSSINLILELLVREKLDFLVVTESWLRHDDDHWLRSQQLAQHDYKCDNIPRPSDRRGGGILLIYKKYIQIQRLDYQFRFCEAACWKLSLSNNIHTTCLAIYHPPATSNTVPDTLFVDNFLDDLEPYISDNKNNLIIGDFNIHVNDKSDDTAIFFVEAMESLGFTQHVSSATHNAGNTIDLIFQEDPSPLGNSNCQVLDFVSDHQMVVCQTEVNKQCVQKQYIKSRKLVADGLEILELQYNDGPILTANSLS